ncbi:MAG: MOSC domain-containing protein [Acidimicrobiales bacterium]
MSEAFVFETCSFCGFDAEEWNDQDTIKTVDHAGYLADHWVAGLAPEVAMQVGVRPAPADPFSIVAFVDHVATTYDRMRRVIELVVTGADVPPADLGQLSAGGEASGRSLDEAVARLDAAGRAMATTLRTLSADDWLRSASPDSPTAGVRWISRHVVHDLLHHLIEIEQIRAGAGDAVPSQSGVVTQVNSSGGGVPKHSVDLAVVGRRGVHGDVQKSRQFHGRPWQALSLWSSDVIRSLNDEGHPTFAGSCGENLTLTGLDWARLRAGATLQMGEVRCQLSAPAEPCSQLKASFVDGNVNRINHDRHPGFSRWYASVLIPGTVRPGDTVTVTPT